LARELILLRGERRIYQGCPGAWLTTLGRRPFFFIKKVKINKKLIVRCELERQVTQAEMKNGKERIGGEFV
jgi:hypothetical protein